MKLKYTSSLLAIMAGLFFFLSCRKDYSCEGCNGNKPPIAIAGPDQVITLPTDSISLDGSASNDPDGTISEWIWKKISGPASLTIVTTTKAKTMVRSLDSGVYQFELKVTDDKGSIASDTMQVAVNWLAPTNRPPVADAGADQTIFLPANSVTLQGIASTDPDNNIAAYAWSKISGPSSFTIVSPNGSQTLVTNLTEGIYQFDLKVTDAMGLFDRDTVAIAVQVTVCPAPSTPPPCTTNCDKIVFVSDRDGNDEIYTCNSDGSSITRLTNDPAADKHPVWSPDGTKIAFVKSLPGIGDNIFIMNADGSNVVQLTFSNYAFYPSWSPDGTKIAFTEKLGSQIKVVNISNGSVLMQTGMYGSSVIPCPAWSPVGSKIAFDSDWNAWDFISDIFTICPDGGNLSLLTTKFSNDLDYWKPGWAPNGAKLSVTIFPMIYQGGNTVPGSIGVMNSDGTGLTVIVTGNMGDIKGVTKTSWSPNGELIAYTSWDSNNTKSIKWIAANGSGASGTIITNGWDADWKH